MNGIINVYKEKGYTSHDVVARMRGIVKQKKIGHTGTLDPQAEGVLPVCLGSATKLCGMLTDWDKEYVAEFLFGVTTDTQDMTGEILSRSDTGMLSEEAVREAVSAFVGGYEQLPPMYSAKKVNGKKLYQLAREGREVERKAVPVIISELEILSLALPEIRLRVCCSKGTYIRTLGHDIGQRLGCGAAMKSLKRTRVGEFSLAEARKLSEIEELAKQERLSGLLLLPDAVFSALPALTAKGDGVKRLENGNPLPVPLLEPGAANAKGQARVYDGEGRFYGIYEWEEGRRLYRPVKMFLER